MPVLSAGPAATVSLSADARREPVDDGSGLERKQDRIGAMGQPSTLRSRLVDYIGAEGPVDLDQIVDFAVRQGITTARKPHTAIRTSLAAAREVVRLPGDLYASLLRLYDGLWVTLRARHATGGRRWICPGPAVSPLAELIDRTGLPLHSGGEVTADRASGLDAWVGPAGWLPDVAAGELVGLQLVGDRLRVRAVVLSEQESQKRTALTRTAVERHLTCAAPQRSDRAYSPGWGANAARSPLAQLAQAVRSAVFEDPTPFRVPTPPLDEVLNVPPAIDSLWAEVPDPWVKHAERLREELAWMERQDRQHAKRRHEDDLEWMADRHREERDELDRRYGDGDGTRWSVADGRFLNDPGFVDDGRFLG